MAAAGTRLSIRYQSAVPDTYATEGKVVGRVLGGAAGVGVFLVYPPAGVGQVALEGLAGLCFYYGGGFAGEKVGHCIDKSTIATRTVSLLAPERHKSWLDSAGAAQKAALESFLTENVLGWRGSLSGKLMILPVITPCGHTFDAKRIYEHLDTSSECPTCSAGELTRDKLLINGPLFSRVISGLTRASIWNQDHPERCLDATTIDPILDDLQEICDALNASEARAMRAYAGKETPNLGSNFGKFVNRMSSLGLLSMRVNLRRLVRL